MFELSEVSRFVRHELSIALKISPFLDEAWQFWITPFCKLRRAISGLLPARIKNDVTRTILHRWECVLFQKSRLLT